MKRYFAACTAALILIAALGGGVQAAQRSRFVSYGSDSVAQAFAPASAQTPLLPAELKTAAGFAPPPFGNLYWLIRILSEEIRDLREDEDPELPVVIGLGCGSEQTGILKLCDLRHIQQQEVAVHAGLRPEPGALGLIMIG